MYSKHHWQSSKHYKGPIQKCQNGEPAFLHMERETVLKNITVCKQTIIIKLEVTQNDSVEYKLLVLDKNTWNYITANEREREKKSDFDIKHDKSRHIVKLN